MSKETHVLSISDVEKDKDSYSLYVLNSSNPRGVVNFTMNDGMGSQQTIRVPVTFIPVDLSTQASKEALIKSPQFRRLVQQLKMLTIISTQEAEKRLQEPAARKEQVRINNLAQELSVDPSTVPNEVKVVQAEGSGEVSGFAMNLALATGMDEDAVITTLMGQEGAMTQADFQYLAQTSEFARVKSFCAERIIGGA